MEKPESQDPWHYPRPRLAEKYLKIFDIGLIAAQGFFAKYCSTICCDVADCTGFT
jgi:hypothetical protein